VQWLFKRRLVHILAYTIYLEVCRRFETGGVPRPTSECRRVPQPRWVEREAEREGGKRGGRRPA
jgi:hypothetical protein